MEEYGFSDTSMLGGAEDEDLADCFRELQVKKPHQAKIRHAVRKLPHNE
jgi:hypothetical protein